MEIHKFNKLFLAYSEVYDGNMSEKYGHSAIANRQKFVSKCGYQIGKSFIMNLVGNDEIRVVKDADRKVLDAEGLVTKMRELPILLLTADCIPATLYDQTDGVLGLVHLGRDNSDKKLLAKMIDEMLANGAKLESLKLILGPGIRKQSYVFKDLPVLDSDWSDFSDQKDGQINLDIFGFNVEVAKSCGVRAENIVDVNIDTFVNKNYYSHRRALAENSDEGRFLTLAVMQVSD